MKLVSWNVNGIRSVLRQGFLDYVAAEDPDVICLQEVRALPEQVVLDLPGYQVHWNPAVKKGYSGTAILTRRPAESITRGLPSVLEDDEGRVITGVFPEFYLVNVYTPNAKRDLSRLDYRTKVWDVGFLTYLKGLEKDRPVIFCGDLNVAHKEIDLANPKSNANNAGFTPEERSGFDNLVQAGFVDTFREFNKEGGHYSWWSQMGRAREKNIGWRIDYFCISPHLRSRLKTAAIRPQVLGSDHCPVVLELNQSGV